MSQFPDPKKRTAERPDPIRERPIQSPRMPRYCAGMDYGAAASDRIERLSEIVCAAPSLMQVLRTVRGLGLPDWLVMSGAVYQPGPEPSDGAPGRLRHPGLRWRLRPNPHRPFAGFDRVTAGVVKRWPELKVERV